MSEGITPRMIVEGEWTFHDEHGMVLPAEMIMGVDFGLDQSCAAVTVFKVSHEDGSVTFASPPPTPSVDIDKAIGGYIDEWIRIVREHNRRWRRKCVRARKNRRGW